MKPMLAMAAAIAMCALPATALGHVSLVSSTPRAGQDLDAPPTVVTLIFDGELDPFGSEFTVLDPNGNEVGSGEVDLDVADRNVLAGSVEISEPGGYTVEWTVLGADGHEITGAFTFAYATEEEVPSTAAARPVARGNPLLPIGIGLLTLAGVVAVRRRAVR